MLPNGTNARVSRRDVLRTAGVAGAALAAPAALTAQTRPGASGRSASGEAARKNLKLGIFTSVYSELPLEQAVRRIRDDGFRGVVLEYAFADMRFDPLAPDWDVLRKITACFDRHGIEIVGLFGYYNVVDPDTSRRKRGEDRMHLLIRHWKRFGSPVLSVETGTYNRQSEFADSPQNYTESAYVACRAAFEKLARAAEKTGAIVAIEPYWRNIIDSAERAERLFRDVKSPSLRLLMDPCNYFRNDDLPKMKPMLEDIFRRVGRKTVLAHAKDVKAAPNGPDLPAPGLGVLDYPLYLRLLAALEKPMHLVIEHLTLKDVPRARDFVRKQFDLI